MVFDIVGVIVYLSCRHYGGVFATSAEVGDFGLLRRSWCVMGGIFNATFVSRLHRMTMVLTLR